MSQVLPSVLTVGLPGGVVTRTSSGFESRVQPTIDVRDHGVSETATASYNGGAFQDAADAAEAAGGARLVIPRGDFAHTPFTLDGGTATSLAGAGRGITNLTCATDTNTSTSAIGTTNCAADSRSQIAHLTLVGPSAAGGLGTKPADMHGIRWGGGWSVRHVAVHGFNSGLLCYADHNELDDVWSSSNYAGVYWGPSPTSEGDHYVMNLATVNNRHSSILVAADSAIGGATFVGGHLGGCPYAFYKEGTGTPSRPVLIYGSVMVRMPFESYGNAAFASQGTGVTAEVVLVGCGQSGAMNGDTSITLGSGSVAYSVDLDSGSAQFYAIGANPFVPGTSGVMRAGSFTTQPQMFESPIFDECETSTVPYFVGDVTGVHGYMGRVRCKAYAMQGAVARYELVRANGNPFGVKYDTGGTIPLGVAMHSASSGQAAVLATRDRTTVKATTAVNAGGLRLVGATGSDAGKVKPYTAGTDDPATIVGYSLDAQSSGLVQADLTIG